MRYQMQTKLHGALLPEAISKRHEAHYNGRSVIANMMRFAPNSSRSMSNALLHMEQQALEDHLKLAHSVVAAEENRMLVC